MYKGGENMSKKMIAAVAFAALLYAASVPVYAQTVSPSPVPTSTVTKPGFFGEIESFFSNLFHRHKSVSGQNQTGIPVQGVTPGENVPSGTIQQNHTFATGSDYFTMQENRVTRL